MQERINSGCSESAMFNVPLLLASGDLPYPPFAVADVLSHLPDRFARRQLPRELKVGVRKTGSRVLR